MAFDPSKIVTSVYGKWGARGVQLLSLTYLFYRYSRAWVDGKWRDLLTGSAAQGSVLGFEIPYEIVTALTPAIVFGMEYWCVLYDRAKGRPHRPVGFWFGAVVLVVANAYFWVAPRLGNSVYVTEGTTVTNGLAFCFSIGSVIAMAGMLLVARSHDRGTVGAAAAAAAVPVATQSSSRS